MREFVDIGSCEAGDAGRGLSCGGLRGTLGRQLIGQRCFRFGAPGLLGALHGLPYDLERRVRVEHDAGRQWR